MVSIMIPANLLVLAPHADDEVIGAGGIIAKVLRAGSKATVAVANSYSHTRMSEARAAGIAMGGASVTDLGFADQWLTDVPRDRVVTRIEHLVDIVRPDCVLLPDPQSAHQEHRAVAEAAMAAMRPSGGTDAYRPSVVACYEQAADVWRLSEPRHPTWFVELHLDEVRRKMAAMKAHASQERPWPSERSEDALCNLARLRGAQAGVDWAEAFAILRWLS
jgi:LmbE family N-acetylglucosaminyl deacetylase